MPFATVATKDVASESALRPQKTRTRLSDPARWLLFDSALLLSRRRPRRKKDGSCFRSASQAAGSPGSSWFLLCLSLSKEAFFFFSKRPQGRQRGGVRGEGRTHALERQGLSCGGVPQETHTWLGRRKRIKLRKEYLAGGRFGVSYFKILGVSPPMNDNNFLTAPNWPQPLGMPPRIAQAHPVSEGKFSPDRPFFR